jgi:hypothetical protein
MSITMQPIGGVDMKCFCDWGHGYRIGHQKEQRKPKTRTWDRLRDVSAVVRRWIEFISPVPMLRSSPLGDPYSMVLYRIFIMHEEPRHPRPCRDVI